MNPACHLVDDGGTEVVAVEAARAGEPGQALWVRVGRIYHSDTPADEPGVWVNYQEKYMTAPLTGPVLLTPQVWRELNAAVRGQLPRRHRLESSGAVVLPVGLVLIAAGVLASDLVAAVAATAGGLVLVGAVAITSWRRR